MNITQVNIITVIIIGIFVIPMLVGAVEPFSREKVRYSFASLVNNIEFLLALLLAIFLTNKIFFDHDMDIFKQIYNVIPEFIKTALYGRDILTYIFAVPILLSVILPLLRLVTNPLYRYVIAPVCDGIFYVVDVMPLFFKRIIGALWYLPKSVFLVFVCGLLLNFYAYYFSTPQLTKWINESAAYQVLYDKAIYPVLNSNVAKKIPVIVSDSFGDAARRQIPQPGNSTGSDGVSASGSRVRVIEYFNGVTLDEAIKSNAEIDRTAKEIVGNEKNSKRKAYLIYRWISRNVKYDYDKAARISSSPNDFKSGSVVTYETRKGICFDYSSLYISMCRAVGLKVRLITGLGYSGIAWGDHAWNQVFSTEENRWINVDTTFGTTGNYFDKPDFSVDHKYAEIQGEW